MPSEEALESALAYAVEQYVDNPASQAHAARVAFKVVNGRRTSQRCVQVVVPQKLSSTQLAARNEPRVYDTVVVPEGSVVIDVIERPLTEIALLWDFSHAAYATLTSREQQRCQGPTIGGGAQIQPAGANWVGTLGMMLRSEGQVAAITNAHVSGLQAARGHKLHQPTRGNSDWFAQVARVVPISFARDAQNLVDLALLSVRDADGRHTVRPEQIGIGPLGSGVVKADLGLVVIKSGRTTGVTQGTCVGIKGVQHVSYGSNKTARFVDQDIFEDESGADFSMAGDSGSAILSAEGHHFVSLLFAGGGSETIGCPARHVMQAIDGTMFNK